MTASPGRSLHTVLFVVLVNLATIIFLFLLVEGLSSTVMAVRSAVQQDLIAERRHTQYDEEIGWINEPNLSITDMYGGKPFITNSMSFRNAREFGFSVPDDQVRIICSGDSFTMGYGVGNDEAWCSLLESMDGRIESVNLGQGGYGFDQAYLWYKRNSDKLEYDIHLFAFITEDFNRMMRSSFLGYGKSLLVLQNDQLVNVNRPVPRRSYIFPRLPVLQEKLSQLNSVKLLKSVLSGRGRLRSREKNAPIPVQARDVVAHIITDLRKINSDKNSILVLVYLPTKGDYKGGRSERWRQYLRDEAREQSVVFIDLIDELRKHPPEEIPALFDGHYSEEGNLYVARALHGYLLSIPETARRLQERRAQRTAAAVP